MADDGTLTKDEIDEIAGKVGNLNTKNPYRVVYNMVLGATVKTAIGAKNFFTGDVVYNPATNPNGMVFRIACSFMDDVEFTRSAQTDDEMEFCDEQQRQTVTGYEYSFSGREKIDRDLKAFTAANMLRRLTWAPDRRYILIDRVRYQGGPASRFQTDDWCRLYDFSTDVPNYTVGNGEKVTIDFQPIASGNTWDVDLVLQDMAVSVDVPAYAEGESFMANENVDWAIGPRGSISTPKAPKASEINALTNRDRPFRARGGYGGRGDLHRAYGYEERESRHRRRARD